MLTRCHNDVLWERKGDRWIAVERLRCVEVERGNVVKRWREGDRCIEVVREGPL